MNLSVIFNAAMKTAKAAGKTVTLATKAHAPEILIGAGIVSFGGTVVMACKATVKAHDILEVKEEVEAKSDNALTEGRITLQEHADNQKRINRNTRWQLIKAYAPTATMGVTAVILILGGYRVVNGRLAMTAAAYKTLEAGFDKYRDNVISEFGKDVDWRMLHGMTEEEQKERQKEICDRKELKQDNPKKELSPSKYTRGYARIFDSYAERWRRYWTPQEALEYVRNKENELNDKLQIQRFLFLNDVYEAFGLEKTPEGQLVGWIIRRDHPSKVDLGVRNMPEDELRRILGTRENDDIRIWLTPNPDGIIYSLIDQKDYTVMM